MRFSWFLWMNKNQPFKWNTTSDSSTHATLCICKIELNIWSFFFQKYYCCCVCWCWNILPLLSLSLTLVRHEPVIHSNSYHWQPFLNYATTTLFVWKKKPCGFFFINANIRIVVFEIEHCVSYFSEFHSLSNKWWIEV